MSLATIKHANTQITNEKSGLVASTLNKSEEEFGLADFASILLQEESQEKPLQDFQANSLLEKQEEKQDIEFREIAFREIDEQAEEEIDEKQDEPVVLNEQESIFVNLPTPIAHAFTQEERVIPVIMQEELFSENHNFSQEENDEVITIDSKEDFSENKFSIDIPFQEKSEPEISEPKIVVIHDNSINIVNHEQPRAETYSKIEIPITKLQTVASLENSILVKNPANEISDSAAVVSSAKEAKVQTPLLASQEKLTLAKKSPEVKKTTSEVTKNVALPIANQKSTSKTQENFINSQKEILQNPNLTNIKIEQTTLHSIPAIFKEPEGFFNFSMTRYFAESLPEMREAGGAVQIDEHGTVIVDFLSKAQDDFSLQNFSFIEDGLEKPSITPDKRISLAIKHAVNLSKSEINITLYPKSLGTVEVKIELVSIHGKTPEIHKIEILAEKKETLDLLKQSGAELRKSLEQVPEIKKEASLHFGSSSDQEHHQQNHQTNMQYFAQKQGKEDFDHEHDFSFLEDEILPPNIVNDEYITEHSVNIRV